MKTLDLIFTSAVLGLTVGGVSYMVLDDTNLKKEYPSLSENDAAQLRLDTAYRTGSMTLIGAIFIGGGAGRKDSSGGKGANIRKPKTAREIARGRLPK